MHLAATMRLFGLLLMAFSSTLLVPAAVSLLYTDGEFPTFAASFVLTFLTGVTLWFPVRAVRAELRVRDGFVIVAMFWTVLGLLSAIPFMLVGHLHLPFTDAVFEAVSGFTTTGATVIVGLDNLPPSLLFYRQQLQWLGGMGIIVLAVAVIPMLGVGGMQLYRAETPGPMKHQKLTPRIADTARVLWIIYVGLTAACAFAYWLAGMSAFDAIGHSFATLATGGFSTHDASIGYFDSAAIDCIAVIFMFLGAVNFALHFRLLRGSPRWAYPKDPEFIAFALIVGISIIVMTALLAATGEYTTVSEDLRYATFQVVSCITTTGFTTADFNSWPSFLPIMLIYLSFVGGCTGSTSGGMKIIRIVLLAKQIMREVTVLIHPRAVVPVKLGRHVMDAPVLSAIWGFAALYGISTALFTMIFIGTGLDTLSAFAATGATLNLLGPGLGDVAANFAGTGDATKWTGVLAMLMGRLELFTVFVLLTPGFWRR
jgi:trk system potassium uptake protein TrkH